MRKPRDAVIWLWNAHNAITSEIFLEAGEYIVEQDAPKKTRGATNRQQRSTQGSSATNSGERERERQKQTKSESKC